MSELVRPDARWFLLQLQVNRHDHEDGCSYWTSEIKQEYPTCNIAGHRFWVHRFVAAMWWGPDAVRDRDVHHLCERKNCINPRHLVPLTSADHKLVHSGLLKVEGRDAPVGAITIGAALDVSRERGRGARAAVARAIVEAEVAP